MRSHVWLAAGLVLAVLACAVHAQEPPSAPPVTSSPPSAESDTYDLLIRLKSEVKPRQVSPGVPKIIDTLTDAVRSKLADWGVDAPRNIGSLGFLSVKIKKELTGLLSLPLVQAALDALGLETEDNGSNDVHQTIPDDTRWRDISRSMTQIKATDAWATWTGSNRIKVCVIDTGVAYQHPDLRGQMRANSVFDAVNDRFAAPNNDDLQHGTHVAGTVAAVGNNGVGVAGVSWRTDLLGCKFMIRRPDGSTQGFDSDAIQCIRWCRDQGAKITVNSWGAQRQVSRALLQEMQLAQDAGMLFVVSAGNDGQDVDRVPYSPGGVQLPSVLSVGAVDGQDRRGQWPPGSSNFGRNTIDLMAPGVNVLSTVPNGYDFFSGTSMACPHVGGAAALLWSYAPGSSYQDIRRAITSTVDPLTGSAANTKTGGRLNVLAALNSLRRAGPAAPPPAAPPPDGGDGSGDCTDEYTDCPQWAQDGFCEPGWFVDNKPVGTEVCPLSCNNCPARTQAVVSEQAVTEDRPPPSLDITGVWNTSSTNVSLYLRYDPYEGRGYGVWLSEPPQSLRLRFIGGNHYLLSDYLNNIFNVTAVGGADNITATSLIVGSGDEQETWTRADIGDKALDRTYVVQEGDTLESIAAKLNTDTGALTDANPILADLPPQPGMSILVPGGSSGGAAQFFPDTSTGADWPSFPPDSAYPPEPPLGAAPPDAPPAP